MTVLPTGSVMERVEHSETRPSRVVLTADGTLIGDTAADEASDRDKIVIIPSEGRAPLMHPDAPGSGGSMTFTGRPMAVRRGIGRPVGGVSAIWSQPRNGRLSEQLTDFGDLHIDKFAWSRDGKQLACSRSSVVGDVVLISNFS